MADLSRPPSRSDDGDWIDSYSGEHFIEEFEDKDEKVWYDIEVDIDDGNLYDVLSVEGDRDRARCEAMRKRLEENGWEYDGE